MERVKGSMRVDFAEEQINLNFDCYDCPLKQMDCLRVTPYKRQTIYKFAFFGLRPRFLD